MKDLLHAEGMVFGFLDKAGRLIILSVLWILGSLPVVTLGTASAALYYAVVKSVRAGQGRAAAEFVKSYRGNLGRGILVTVIFFVLLAAGLWAQQAVPDGFPAGCIRVALILLLLASVFTVPILSRFRINPGKVWKLAFSMSTRFPHYALLLLAGTGILTVMQIYVLPIPTVLIQPGAWCFLSSLLTEKILLQYMPPKETNDNAWYYEI